MARISEHFSTEEFQCRCGCGLCHIEPELVEQLEMIREYFAKPVIIYPEHSVNRCEKHNAEVGGDENSQHLKGKAADFHAKNISLKTLHFDMIRFYKEGKIRNLGLYDWGVHIDTRDDKHIWDRRSHKKALL